MNLESSSPRPHETIPTISMEPVAPSAIIAPPESPWQLRNNASYSWVISRSSLQHNNKFHYLSCCPSGYPPHIMLEVILELPYPAVKQSLCDQTGTTTARSDLDVGDFSDKRPHPETSVNWFVKSFWLPSGKHAGDALLL